MFQFSLSIYYKVSIQASNSQSPHNKSLKKKKKKKKKRKKGGREGSMKREERNFTVATEKKRITVPLTSVPSLFRVCSERESANYCLW